MFLEKKSHIIKTELKGVANSKMVVRLMIKKDI